ncbi:MAG: hypothetical protein H6739_40335 [Alphaproteobacteria bacterium]|nr:hypothetical protein [Alphaproteobacteria bacterium]
MMTPKATSVTEAGKPDGYAVPELFRGEVSPDGRTRLAVCAPPERLAVIHRALVEALEAPLSVMYVQRVDRRAGRNLEESGGKPRRYLSVDIPAERVLSVFDRCRTLLYQDGRHQTWVRGAMREQLILEYDGMLFLYPDDLSFRDVLHGLGVREDAKAQAIGDRDYVKVNFQATADPEEARLMAELRLQEYGEG